MKKPLCLLGLCIFTLSIFFDVTSIDAAVKCYRCKEIYPDSGIYLANDNKDCQEEFTCQSSADTCFVNMSYEVAAGKLVIEKGCRKRYDCELTSKLVQLQYHCDQHYTKRQCYECCNDDLCNKSGGKLLQSSSVSIAATTIFISFFLFR